MRPDRQYPFDTLLLREPLGTGGCQIHWRYMLNSTLLRAGLYLLFGGFALLFVVPFALDSSGMHPWNRSSLEPILFLYCVSITGAGAFLTLRSGHGDLADTLSHSQSAARIFPAMPLRSVLPRPSFRAAALIHQPPNFGLIYGAVLWILIFLFMIIDAPRQIYGLPITFSSYPSAASAKSPWQETLSVYIAPGDINDGKFLGSSANFFINGREVPREQLREALQQELNRRVEWTVYFEAHPDTLYMDAVFAMDTIQGLGAHLIWLTPKLRQQLGHSNGASQDNN
jgi:biopolymer transport protein ExbD